MRLCECLKNIHSLVLTMTLELSSSHFKDEAAGPGSSLCCFQREGRHLARDNAGWNEFETTLTT